MQFREERLSRRSQCSSPPSEIVLDSIGELSFLDVLQLVLWVRFDIEGLQQAH